MAYVKYIKTTGGRYSEPTLVIRKNGVGYIALTAIRMFGDKRYINLYYDSQKRSIGIAVLDAQKMDALKLSQRNKTLEFCMVGFLKKFKIDNKETKAYRLHWNEQNKMFEISLDRDLFRRGE